ncbi:DUF159-domain-containing protein [Exidia glandulosa HHB12029]|uniref:DUF159-domain-containing protein n=1 Tax=Exidia glandulosa HHB12029 TaxID=1314781 RepID=A0A166NC76_EXIGL|nr:DUF159-domain-containing protein [Exidia glandulosa HHB12029]
MCGRFALGRGNFVPFAQYQRVVQPDEWIDRDNFHPRNNIAPRSYAPVIRRQRDEAENSDQSRVVMQTMRWGVVPHWTRFDAPSSELKTINARGENLLEVPTGLWASLKKYKRCIVPADGYFEWLASKKPGDPKRPHFVKHKEEGRMLLLAGLWDHVKLQPEHEGEEGKDLWTFAIVTVEANKQLGWLHDRMPLILTDEADIDRWLDLKDGWTQDVVALVKPYAGPALNCYEVPPEVGKVGTDSPSYVLPISERKDGIQAMFSRQTKAKSSSSTATPTASASKLKDGDVLTSRNTDDPEPTHEQVIEILSSPSPSVIEILDSSPTTPSPNTPASSKRKRSEREGSPTPTAKKKLKQGTSPQKKSLSGADKGTAKITKFFGKA